MLQLNKATSPSIKITVCPTPPLFNLFRDTVNAFNHTFSGRGGRRGEGCNLKLLEIRVLQNLVGSERVARNLGMGGRERDIIQNWTIIFGIRQFMMLWFPGEQCVIALQELIFDNKSFCQLVMVRVKEKESKYQIFPFTSEMFLNTLTKSQQTTQAYQYLCLATQQYVLL